MGKEGWGGRRVRVERGPRRVRKGRQRVRGGGVISRVWGEEGVGVHRGVGSRWEGQKGSGQGEEEEEKGGGGVVGGGRLLFSLVILGGADPPSSCLLDAARFLLWVVLFRGLTAWGP